MQRRQPALAQRLHITQGTRNDPVTQRHDQPALFGQWHELIGRKQSAFAMSPAHQRFQTHDISRDQIQARLVMQFKFVAAQRSAQFTFEVGQASRIAIDALVEHVIGTALGRFGLLHGDVCMPHQGVGPGVDAGMGNPEAATEQKAFAVDPVRLGQHLDEAFGHPLGTLRRSSGIDQQCEFITAKPC